MPEPDLLAVALLAGAYLLGAIPFSFVVARLWGVPDVRRVGSGNVGATNVMRAAGTGAGALAFSLDAGKGAAAVLLAQGLAAPDPLPALVAATAVIGHMFPVWLGFKGGKGVATGAGAFLPIAPTATGVALVVFAIAVALTRFVSVGSTAAALTLPLAAWALGAAPAVVVTAVGVAGLIVFKHRGNLARIRRGLEDRLGDPRS